MSTGPTVATETVTYPVRRAGGRAVVPAGQLQTSELYELQHAIASARLALLERIIRDGYVTAGEASVRIVVEVEQPAVSAEATNGRAVALPPGRQHLTVARHRETWRTT